ncbi:Lcl C-terminal domain-containing protein [Flavobacterium aciduliphilum]|uniref:Uncharacterized protein DUF1566 n=1 Tax=Flavobacterium aciduliphilum TaxID=1101402 RepID=A0A328YRX7_9FLAO|nr:DUF1566 domain-containing protein [Flavobacterium aciduliphilum]RAR75505.1 uncharacterized protein DUF1566 [Flavobacterium aciduliphilum]
MLCLLSSFCWAQVTKSIALLPDTGQTTSYTTTFGEDNDYSINPPAYTNNGNGTVTDLVTGLMWQQTDGGEMTIENAFTYCDNLVLGGFDDWRLPTPMEAYTLMILQNNNPALNTSFFTTTAAEYWWTNTYQAGDNTKVWVTNSGGGIGNHPKSETISAGGTHHFHVRAVRNSSPSTQLSSRFIDNADGTVTDQITQLIWQKTPNTNALTWEEALTYAENLVLANNTDWRLPNIKELQSLNDESRTAPSTNTFFFPSIGVKNYWSSTTLKPNPTNPSSAWYWNTQYGITTYDVKSNTNYALCVRGIPTTLSSHEIGTNFSNTILNPFHSKIVLENNIKNTDFQLISPNGVLIYEGTNLTEQDFSSLPEGVYYLKNRETRDVFKLLKN